MDILKGAPVAKKINEETLGLIEKNNLSPCIVIVRVGDSEADMLYIRGVMKTSEKLGIKAELIEKSADVTTEEMLALVDEINANENIHGCLMLRPLPKHVDSKLIENRLSAIKDCDCMTEVNLGRVLMGARTEMYPATARAAIELMKFYDIKLAGSNITVINRNNVIGRPVASMLIGEDATVTIAHSRTHCLSDVTKNADVIVSAVGRPAMLKDEHLNHDCVVIDIGMGVDADGNLAGDLDINNVDVKAATPVIGGVGAITNAVLINQMVKRMAADK